MKLLKGLVVGLYCSSRAIVQLLGIMLLMIIMVAGTGKTSLSLIAGDGIANGNLNSLTTGYTFYALAVLFMAYLVGMMVEGIKSARGLKRKKSEVTNKKTIVFRILKLLIKS